MWHPRCVALVAVLLALTPAASSAQPASAAQSQLRDPLAGENAVVIWNQATLEAIREASTPAPIAARMLAIVNTAMYDAWAAYDPIATGTDGTSFLKAHVHSFRPNQRQRAMAIAAFYALRDVAAVPMADTTLAQTGQTLARGDEAERIGRAAADAVLRSRHRDGSNQLGEAKLGPYADNTRYRAINTATAVIDPNHWQPLLVYHDDGSFRTQHFLVPQWGDVRPFSAVATTLATLVDAPARLGEPRYLQQARDLLAISANLTDEQKAIAEYWSDGMMTDSPPGHWVRFAIWVSGRDHHDVTQDAKMFFALSNALLDASIVCWRVKRHYDSERPITAIRALFSGQLVKAWAGPGRSAGLIDGAAWQPYQPPEIVTPAFPEFFSGHSTFSAAAAEVLKRFTGSDAFGASFVQKAGSSLVEKGQPLRAVTLRWTNFSEAADQAGMSRRYGGIHFELADMEGRKAGHLVGKIDFDNAMALINGGSERRLTDGLGTAKL